jgi:ABC-2 type transport system permease protein
MLARSPHPRREAAQMAQAIGTLRVDRLAGRGTWIGLKTIVRRECAVIAHFWTITLAPPTVTTLLYFTVFGAILGKRIGSFAGVDYIHYVAPGLIVLWVVPYAFSHTASGFLGARTFRYIEEILVSPLPGWAVMAGYVIGGVVRGLLVGAAAAVTTLLFMHFHVRSIFVTVAAISLAALVSSLGGFLTALFAKTFEQVWAIEGFILTPLMFFGGIFYPISIAPEWAQRLSLANPMLYMVNAVRYGLVGVTDIPAGITFMMMFAAAIAFCVAAVQRLAHGMRLDD